MSIFGKLAAVRYQTARETGIGKRGEARKGKNPECHGRGVDEKLSGVEIGKDQTGDVSGKREGGCVSECLEPRRKKRDGQDIASKKHHEPPHDPVRRGYVFHNEGEQSDVEVQEGKNNERSNQKEQAAEHSSERQIGKPDENRADNERDSRHDRQVRKGSGKNLERFEKGVRDRIEQIDRDLSGLYVFGDFHGEIRRTHGGDLGEYEGPAEFQERNASKKVRRGRVQIPEQAHNEQHPDRIRKKRGHHVEKKDVPVPERYAEELPVFFHVPGDATVIGGLIERPDDFFERRLSDGKIFDFSGCVYPFEGVFYGFGGRRDFNDEKVPFAAFEFVGFRDEFAVR